MTNIDNSGNIHAGDGQFAGHIRAEAAGVALVTAPTTTIGALVTGYSGTADGEAFRDAAHGAIGIVRERFPTAAVLELEDQDDDPDDSQYWMPHKIRDANGDILWEAPDMFDMSDEDMEFTDSLANYTPALDCLGDYPLRLSDLDDERRYGITF